MNVFLKIIICILLFILPFLIVYLIIGFITMDFNVSNWGIFGRFILILTSIPFSLGLLSISIEEL